MTVMVKGVHFVPSFLAYNFKFLLGSSSFFRPTKKGSELEWMSSVFVFGGWASRVQSMVHVSSHTIVIIVAAREMTQHLQYCSAVILLGVNY